MNDTNTDEPVRLDKWLWAARFFKTRRLAREAVEGGKVHYNGQRSKPSRLVAEGAQLRIVIGYTERDIIICKINDKRGPASLAQQLYKETDSSIERNQKERELRKLAHQTAPEKRPDKKQRRLIHRFKRQ